MKTSARSSILVDQIDFADVIVLNKDTVDEHQN